MNKNPIIQFEIGDMKNFVYLVIDWSSEKAVMIDPQKDVTAPLEFLEQNQIELQSILLTHSHHDHVAGVPELVKRFPQISITLHKKDQHRLSRFKTHLVHPGPTVHIGALVFEVLHTPGHSAGELCYFLAGNPPALFSGDTLFIRDCGRTDFPTGSDQEMFDSLQRLKKLPPETILYPGHHYAPEFTSTLGVELLTSPPLLAQNLEDFKKLP